MPPTVSAIEVFSFALSAEGGPRPVVVVKLTASDGMAGWGEAAPDPRVCPETRESILSTLGRYFAPAVLQKPLADLDGLHRAMDRAIAPLCGPSMPLARAALDIAAHDCLCRHLHLTLADFLGHHLSNSVRLSWKVTGTTLSEVEASLQSARQRGFRNFTLDLTGSGDWDLRLTKTVCDAFPGGTILGCGQGLYPPHEALGRIKLLAEVGLNLIEEPLSADLGGHAPWLLARSPIPIVLGRSILGPSSLLMHLKNHSMTGVMLHVGRLGGFLPARQCAELGGAAGMLLLCGGLCDGGIGFSANVQLAAAFGISTPASLCGPQIFQEEILAAPLSRDADTVQVLSKPGLGIEVDEDKIRSLAGRAGGTSHRIG